MNTSTMRIFEAGRGEVGERLARDREDLSLVRRPIASPSFRSSVFSASRRLAASASAASRASSIRRLPSALASSVALPSRAARCPSNASFFCLNSSRSFCASAIVCFGVRESRRRSVFRARRSRRGRLVQKALQQPHQDQEVERLRADGEPVDEHLLAHCAAAAAMTWFQNGLAKIRIIETTKQ